MQGRGGRPPRTPSWQLPGMSGTRTTVGRPRRSRGSPEGLTCSRDPLNDAVTGGCIEAIHCDTVIVATPRKYVGAVWKGYSGSGIASIGAVRDVAGASCVQRIFSTLVCTVTAVRVMMVASLGMFGLVQLGCRLIHDRRGSGWPPHPWVAQHVPTRPCRMTSHSQVVKVCAYGAVALYVCIYHT
jgi:hypothetical protein